MKKTGVFWAILTLALLVVLVPSMKTFFEGLVTAIPADTMTDYPFIAFIFNNLTLWIILITVGALGWAILKSFKGRGGTGY